MEESTATAKRAGSAADTEEDFSTVPTTTAASESGIEDLTISETDSNIRLTAPDESNATTSNPTVEATTASTTAVHESASTASQADTHALNPSSTGLVLFDLTSKPGGTACFSPHTIKTLLDLKLLNVGYERQRLTFIQIRNDLASRIADNVTVPALELSDGSHVVDSWNIAEYLERQHPEGGRIFGGKAGKRLAAMLNQFGKTVLAPHIGPLAQKGIHGMLDDESARYFADVKIGAARWRKVSGMGEAERTAHVEAAVAKLEVVNAMLTCEGGGAGEGVSGRSGPKSRGPVWLAGGDEPTHADFVLFGWYVFTRTAGQRTTKEIWGAHQAVWRWVEALESWAGELADDFV